MEREIVIVGAGFGGVRAALKLANKREFKVKLITPETYFEYHAALYRSATGRSPLEVTIPLQDFLSYAKNIEIVKDKVAKIDQKNRKLVGESGSKYSYDEAILALGSTTDYYNIPGLEKYAYGVKSIDQALKLKRHLHEQLTNEDPERAYVVVGAGATGVELSAEMLSYLKFIRKKHQINTKNFKIYLVEANKQVLGALPKNFAKKVEKRLRKVGVELMLDTAIESETADAIKLPNQEIDSHTVVWTAGVTNNPFFTENENFELGRMKKVKVNDYLESSEGVYVIGDSADTKYSGMAQTALYDASYVVEDLFKKVSDLPRKKYVPKKPIYAIPVGPRWAAVLWGKVKINGRLGWLLRRIADLRLYIKFLPLRKALITWRYGLINEEICEICKK